MLVSALFSLVFLGGSIVAALPSPNDASFLGLFRRQAPATSPTNPICNVANLPIKAPKPNIWGDLTSEEVRSVIKWLLQPERGLNITYQSNTITAYDNILSVVELVMPNKTDALNYMDKSGKMPERYARVTIDVGNADIPYLDEYMVGPLPISDKTTIQPYSFTYNGGRSRTPHHARDWDRWVASQVDVMSGMYDITMDLLGTYMNGTANDTSTLGAIDPLLQEDGRIMLWVEWQKPQSTIYDTETLLSQGLFMKFDFTGRDESKWKLLNILYDNIMYDSVEEFRDAWKKPGFNKLMKVEEGEWAYATKHKGKLPHDDQLPPIAEQKEQRWQVDRNAKYVKWMDFSFYIGFTRDLGLALFDVKYKGERILYELGLQEAVAHYAGADPRASMTAYVDSIYGMGTLLFSLVRGYDCPTYATYLDTATVTQGNTSTNHDSICMFEMDAGYPIQRHTGGAYVTVTKNIAFVLRSVSVVGNYDYMFDYVFYQDGSIEVKVRASGYIRAAYYAHNHDYGYRIREHLSGSMHSHVLSFKADFDIKGRKNTFEKTAVVSKAVKYPWSKKPRNTMKLERSLVENEDDGKINWPSNGASIYSIVNLDKPNKYGEYPGYRIAPASGTPVHLQIEKSPVLKNVAEFTTHHLYVTKQKDTEPRLGASASNRDGEHPLVEFGKFFNGENVKQEDIVVWFNLGMHHVPHTGDLPNTVMTGAQSSVMISPHNYLPEDASRQTMQQIDIAMGQGANGENVISNFGKKEYICAVDYQQYVGPSESVKYQYEQTSLHITSGNSGNSGNRGN
ncbi:copper amine oxidase [Pyronema omphalodes]|nr:copper amine oxidase [Pyronema omphalodes]